MTLLIIAVLGILVIQAGTLIVLFRFASGLRNAESRLRQDVQQTVLSFINSPGQDKPSPLAILIDNTATVFAGRIIQQIKQGAAGVASGVSKAEDAAALGEVSQVNPMAALMAGLLPKKFKKQLLANPQMLQQLSMFGGAAGGNGHLPQSNDHRSIRDRL